MSARPRFNYIITIHNKEDIIEQVMMCVLMCCRDNSHIYPVIDGCTDKTEAIIDSITEKFSDVPITKIYTPDVHEILSINAALCTANQDGDGFNIVLQDDVLLADFMLEHKVKLLYDRAGPDLGIVSFRLGANFSIDAASSDQAVPFSNYVENAYGHGLNQAQMLLPGHLAYRTIPIKSPICIPFKIVRTIGILEENLAPYMHDDTEYAIRTISAGYRNAVFAIRFHSNIEWGGTRKNPHPRMAEFTKRNMDIIRKKYAPRIQDIIDRKQPDDIITIPEIVSEKENILAKVAWDKTRELLNRYQSNNGINLSTKIKSILRKICSTA